MSHPDESTIRRFAMGELDVDPGFVAHVAACDDCSRKLQAEAELEVAMLDVRRRAAAAGTLEPALAHAPGPQPRRTSVARRVLGPALAFAAAAAVLVWAGHDRLRARLVGDDPVARVVSCPEGPAQLACIAEAHRSGSRLEYPKGNALAALGSERGLTVVVEPRSSDGASIDAAAFLATARTEIPRCAAAAIVTQDAPIMTGAVGVNFTVGPDGRVTEPPLAFVLAKEPASAEIEQPLIASDRAVIDCLRRTVRAFAFPPLGPVRMSIAVKYVWRE